MGEGLGARGRAWAWRGLFGALVGGCVFLGTPALMGPRAAAQDAPAEGVAAEETPPQLYQLLYDHQFTEPLSDLGQRVRIWIWLDYMAFDSSQLRRLQRLAARFQEKIAAMNLESDGIVSDYEARLAPHYQGLYAALKGGAPSEEVLAGLAREVAAVSLSTERDDALRKLRVETLRGLLGDEKEFLYSLSPDQEQKLVSSLFFLRTVIDPFANPGTYRDVVGSTWQAGDFTALLRTNEGARQLDIGGIWGIQEGAERPPNYAHIKRNIILFYVLKEPALGPTLADKLATPGR